MSGHTPGPWLVSRYSQSTVLKRIAIRGGNERIALVVVPDTAQSIEEYEANARLIAAAPELLQCLEEARQFIESELWPEHEFVVRLRALCAKAKAQN